MSAKTKIVVLHMKELIYTGIFALLGILFLVLLVVMFRPQKDEDGAGPSGSQTETEEAPGQDAETSPLQDSQASTYIPGVYNTELVLNDQPVNVEVIVDQESISSIRLVDLSEAVATMYPLLEPTFESLAAQICEKQSLDQITYETESKYTSLVILEAIRNSLEKAAP